MKNQNNLAHYRWLEYMVEWFKKRGFESDGRFLFWGEETKDKYDMVVEHSVLRMTRQLTWRERKQREGEQREGDVEKDKKGSKRKRDEMEAAGAKQEEDESTKEIEKQAEKKGDNNEAAEENVEDERDDASFYWKWENCVNYHEADAYYNRMRFGNGDQVHNTYTDDKPPEERYDKDTTYSCSSLHFASRSRLAEGSRVALIVKGLARWAREEIPEADLVQRVEEEKEEEGKKDEEKEKEKEGNEENEDKEKQQKETEKTSSAEDVRTLSPQELIAEAVALPLEDRESMIDELLYAVWNMRRWSIYRKHTGFALSPFSSLVRAFLLLCGAVFSSLF